jgi:predicted kinase
MNRPKLIMLGGFACCGKSTIADIQDHPLTLHIEGDEIITKIGQWRMYGEEAVKSKIALTAGMASIHLHSGYDVIIPMLLGGVYESAYEDVAQEANADFIEVQLDVDKDKAIRRLLARGTWGEAGLPPITEKDLPRIERMYDNMVAAVAERPNIIRIKSIEGDIEGTYNTFVSAIS